MIDEIQEEEYVSPLVVHKKTDASYQETCAEVSMQTTHVDEDTADEPTLERHRFKKKKKKSSKPIVICILVLLAVIVGAVVAKNTNLFTQNKDANTTTAKSYTTAPVNEFEGIITVKNTYIFFEGVEINGIEELEREIKYLEKGTKFTIQDENANVDFLNFEVLSLLSKYGIEYEITHIVSSGLMSVYETTAAPVQSEQPSNEAESSVEEQPSSEENIEN